MQRQPKSLKDASRLLQLIDLLSKTGRQIIDEWSKESAQDDDSSLSKILPSHELYDLQRIVLAATGSLTELVSEPSSRLLEVSTQYFEARALHIAAERRIPDIISAPRARDGEQDGGLSIKEIAGATGIEPLKLCENKILVIISPCRTPFLRSLSIFSHALWLAKCSPLPIARKLEFYAVYAQSISSKR